MSETKTAATSTADREIVMTRIFDAPRELVFEAFTDPKHLSQWCGPTGFTTTTDKFDMKPGGVWRFVMHGPDGADYQNIVTYIEVVKPERLVYKHGGDADCEPVNFQVTATFEDVGPAGATPRKTKLTWQALFPSPAARNFVVEKYGAIEGGKQTLERLGEYLAKR